MILVRRLWADDVGEGDAFLRGVFHHDVGGLFLPVNFAGVGHGGRVGEVRGHRGRVVPAPEDLLPPRRRYFALGETFVKLRRLREACARRCGGPHSRMMRRKLPCCRSAHREATHDHPLCINRVVRLHVGECLEKVNLTGEFVRVAVAPVEVADDGSGRGELAFVALRSVNERQFAQLLPAPVAPEIEAARLGFAGLEVVWDEDAVGLHRAVYFRAVAACDEAGLRVPRHLALCQRGGAGESLLDVVFRDGDLFCVENLVVAQRPVGGLVEDFDVGQLIIDELVRDELP